VRRTKRRRIRKLTEVVPRWEWRTFGDAVGVAEDHFAALVPERVEESGEIYLLSRRSDASVKVRDGLMDVKQLRAVNADGLEQWLPVLKAPFPLSAADVAFVLETLGVPDVPLTRPTYTLDELRHDVVGSSPELVAVDLQKRRERHTVNGCMSELTRIQTAEASTRTMAIESEDPERVAVTVRELGLRTRPNICMAHGLKELIGFDGPRRYAVIDVGTNSVKFHVGERAADGSWTTVVDRAEVERLGEGLSDAHRLSRPAIERTASAIDAMVAEAKREHAVAIAAVGTAGLRIAENRDEFLDAVRERTGVQVEVISGAEEARLAYLAAKAAADLDEGSLVVFDTGGGSSQFTFGHGDSVDEQFSVDVGAVRFTERFGLDRVVSEDELARAVDAIAADLERLGDRPTPDALVGLGGAVTNLAAVKHQLATYDGNVVQGTVLDSEEVARQIELYRSRTTNQRREIVGLQPKRAEIILAGACVVQAVMKKLNRESLVVSDRGLRHGLLVQRFES
jgi:exopolyphosphatase / guanosine-5'-triphosphate,3'-diphosphate pyrophosphatase